MKTIINRIILVFAIIAVVGTSCSDFLDEDNRTNSTEGTQYATRNGLDGLLGASYAYLRGWYGKEAAFGLSEAGSDTWLTGNDNRQKILIDYSGITPEVASTANREKMNCNLDEYWELFYTAINVCNTGIKNVEIASPEIINDADRNAYLGELKTLRAFYYWHLVETWGPVQINTEPVYSVSTEAHRSSVEDVYDFMLTDIDEAIILLDGKTTKTGHINLWAAKALRARFLLYKASKLNDNQAYIDAAAEAEEVIAGSGSSFYPNYSDIWSAANENGYTNNEVIWFVDYSATLEQNIMPKRIKTDENGAAMTWTAMMIRNAANTIGGNASHLMFVGVWDKLSSTAAILKRTDTDLNKVITYKTVQYNVGTSYQPYSKGFTRYVPSGYLLDLFNTTTDQRYQASFRDTYKVASVFTTAFTGGVVPPAGYELMIDTAIYMCPQTVTAGQIARASTRYQLFSRTSVGNPLVFPLYQDAAGTRPTIATGTTGAENYKGDRMFISLKKFDDLSGTIIRDLCSRDAFVIRLSEMYLIAAEGYMMSGQSGPAITKLNELRTARAIAGQTNTLTPAEEAQVSAQDIAVILDERGRELCGEQQRWFDLERTGTLYDRVIEYNGSAGDNIEDFHVLRPIPQPQMDAVTNRTAGPDPEGFWQNTGY